MFGHKSFLVLGGSAGDILSLVKGGYEILDCNFSFQQGVDQKGKATTRVVGGILNVTLSQLPPQPIIDWALDPRKVKEGVVVLLNHENIPIERIIFKNAICVSMGINYTQKGDSYSATQLVINAESLIVGSGINFDKEWV